MSTTTTTTTRRKNKPQRRPNNGRRGMAVQPFGSQPLLPASRRVRLAYAERITLTESAAGAGIHLSFSLNSLFDPNSGGIGAQPVGFDQISSMYGQYRVWGANVKATFQNVSSANQPIMCVIYGTYQPAVPSNPDAWVSQPYGTAASCEPLGGKSSVVLRKRFDIPTVLGLTKEQYTSDMDFVGTPSGNPTRQAYLIVGQRSYGAATSNAYVYVQIEYTVEFSQPLSLNVS